MKTVFVTGFLIFFGSLGYAFEALPECSKQKIGSYYNAYKWVNDAYVGELANPNLWEQKRNNFDAKYGEGCFDAIWENQRKILRHAGASGSPVKLRRVEIIPDEKRQICRKHFPAAMTGSQGWIIKKTIDYIIQYDGIACHVYHHF